MVSAIHLTPSPSEKTEWEGCLTEYEHNASIYTPRGQMKKTAETAAFAVFCLRMRVGESEMEEAQWTTRIPASWTGTLLPERTADELAAGRDAQAVPTGICDF